MMVDDQEIMEDDLIEEWNISTRTDRVLYRRGGPILRKFSRS